MATETPLLSKPLVPMFDAPTRKTILFADSIATLASAKQIAVEEFSKKHDFRWTESNLGTSSKKATFEDPQKNQIINKQIATGILETELFKFLENNLIEKIPTGQNLSELYNLYSQITNEKKTLKEFLKMLANNGKDIEKNIEEFWQHHSDNLVITHINDKVGMGLFLSPHAKPIKKGDIVAIYSGEYDSTPDDQLFHEFSFFISAHPIFSDAEAESQNKIVKGHINATNCGNHARYIQDLPTETELDKYYILPNEIRSSIATANLDPIIAAYHRYPIVYLIANRVIQPGEQLGYSYSTGFWAKAKYLRNIKRALFDKNGQVIDDAPYVNHLDLHFKIDGINHYHRFELIKLKIGVLLEQTAAFFSVAMKCVTIQWQRLMITCHKALCDIDISQNIYLKELFDIVNAKMKLLHPSSSYQVIFCSKVRLSLLAHSVKQELRSDQFSQQKINYIRKVMNSVHSSYDDADQMFKKIAEMLIKDPNYASYFKEHLSDLRSELIKHMNQYNQDKTKLSQITSETVMSLNK